MTFNVVSDYEVHIKKKKVLICQSNFASSYLRITDLKHAST